MDASPADPLERRVVAGVDRDAVQLDERSRNRRAIARAGESERAGGLEREVRVRMAEQIVTAEVEGFAHCVCVCGVAAGRCGTATFREPSD